MANGLILHPSRFSGPVETSHEIERGSLAKTKGRLPGYFHTLVVDRLVDLSDHLLRNDRLRSLLMRQVERLLIRYLEEQTRGSPHPRRVEEDKRDMLLALARSIDRGLREGVISPHVSRTLLRTVIFNVITRSTREVAEARARFSAEHGGYGPPAFLVLSPTKMCNLRCTGCYANAGPSPEKLEWEVFDRIIEEAKSLWGVRFFTISGGEPLMYQSQGKGILDAAKKHSDCFFLMFTNGTLITDRVAAQMAQVGNLTPAISLEGWEARTDARRGPGVYRKVLQAMARLREAGVPFGISLTATKENCEEILSNEFLEFFFEEQKALYGWLFQYMPIGRSYTLDLLPTPAQRVWMWQRTWYFIRERGYFLPDFWNCGTVSNGCIAGGREGGYLYIDWNGKVMPCVFVPYSAVNIHEIYRKGGTLNDAWEAPYFQAIRRWQWEYALGKQRLEDHGNWLIPCSIRDHYDVCRRLLDTYHPEPEDVSAAEALQDQGYLEGMLAYDRALAEAFDPIWRREYLEVEHAKKKEGAVSGRFSA
ncbi:MAG: radical SAM protein [Armatimonadota bacterium]|nr:radical SAM protein [Armatimonadota bacterium]